jgi:type IV pilus assembly protein PilX
VALVVGLIFLLITTLMAITAMSGVVMQERMAGNLRNASIAQAGADSAVRAGENWLRSFHSRGEQLGGNCTALDGVFRRDVTVTEEIDGDTVQACIRIPSVEALRNANTWSDAPGAGVHQYPAELIGDGQLSNPEAAGMARRPQFVIENLGPLRPTGSGSGGEWDSPGSYAEGGAAMVYRVTGRSTGATENVIRVAESFYVGYVGGADTAPTP